MTREEEILEEAEKYVTNLCSFLLQALDPKNSSVDSVYLEVQLTDGQTYSVMREKEQET